MGRWILVVVLGSLLIAACVPQVSPNELRDAVSETVRSRLAADAPPGPVLKVLPGTPLPESGSARVDDFEGYPTGAVLPAVNPRNYGILRYGKGWNRVTITETFGPDGRLGKAVRLEGGVGEGFLTIGAGDWSDYAVRLLLKVHEAPITESHVRFRLFQNNTGSRALEARIGYEGVRLIKIAGDQSFVLIDRPELRELGRGFLRDTNWHELRFVLRSNGQVQFWLDGTLLLEWTDADYKAGGFGLGPKGMTFFIDNLEILRF